MKQSRVSCLVPHLVWAQVTVLICFTPSWAGGGQSSRQPREAACLRSEVRSLGPGGWERLSTQAPPRCPGMGILAFLVGEEGIVPILWDDQAGLAGMRLRAREQRLCGHEIGTLGGQYREWKFGDRTCCLHPCSFQGGCLCCRTLCPSPRCYLRGLGRVFLTSASLTRILHLLWNGPISPDETLSQSHSPLSLSA